MQIKRKNTRTINIGTKRIGAGYPILVQSMCATKTTDLVSTVQQINDLQRAGAGIIRLAVDNEREAIALGEIRARVDATLSVDLQENYKLVERVAPSVDKIRYNPGHLYHHEKSKTWQEKVQYIADSASKYGCAIRIGVNTGSIDPAKAKHYAVDDSIKPALECAFAHAEYLDSIGFHQFCVSLKDSDPRKVLILNQTFAEQLPNIPLHLGVTEAGMPPMGITKTRLAIEPLLRQGIGDTIRVSLTLPNKEKSVEVYAGHEMIADVNAGRSTDASKFSYDKLNIVSCPSCSRVENEAFIQLAAEVHEMSQYAQKHAITIAVMGCRVNGPGETDDADLGLWCGPRKVNLKRKGTLVGYFPYDQILDRLRTELDALIKESEC